MLNQVFASYHLSKDYQALFKLICSKVKIVALVDYTFRDDGTVFRDVCQVARDEPYRILVCARGITYGGLYPFMESEGGEEELFVMECRRMNLEWVPPASCET